MGVVPSNKVEVFETQLQKYWLDYVVTEFKDIESRMHFECQAVDDFAFATTTVCDVASTQRLLSVMHSLPHGVVRNSPSVEGLVQTSIAFSQVRLDVESATAECGLFARSMSMNEMLELNRQLDSLALLFGSVS